METVMTMRRNIKRDARRIEQFNRNKVGRFDRKLNPLQKLFRDLTPVATWLSVAAILFALLAPIEMKNPLISVETIEKVEASEKNNSNSIQAEVEENTIDRRIEECWKKGWTPGVLERGFVCAAPAVELDQK